MRFLCLESYFNDDCNVNEAKFFVIAEEQQIIKLASNVSDAIDIAMAIISKYGFLDIVEGVCFYYPTKSVHSVPISVVKKEKTVPLGDLKSIRKCLSQGFSVSFGKLNIQIRKSCPITWVEDGFVLDKKSKDVLVLPFNHRDGEVLKLKNP